jgi:hypothetical protein
MEHLVYIQEAWVQTPAWSILYYIYPQGFFLDQSDLGLPLVQISDSRWKLTM